MIPLARKSRHLMLLNRCCCRVSVGLAIRLPLMSPLILPHLLDHQFGVEHGKGGGLRPCTTGIETGGCDECDHVRKMRPLICVFRCVQEMVTGTSHMPLVVYTIISMHRMNNRCAVHVSPRVLQNIDEVRCELRECSRVIHTMRSRLSFGLQISGFQCLLVDAFPA